MNKSLCYIHHKEEEIPKGSYVCFECGHVYETAWEIIRMHIESLNESMISYEEGNAKQYAVKFCGLCLHDWVIR